MKEYFIKLGLRNLYVSVPEGMFGPDCSHCAQCGYLVPRSERECMLHPVGECPRRDIAFSVWPHLYINQFFKRRPDAEISPAKLLRFLEELEFNLNNPKKAISVLFEME